MLGIETTDNRTPNFFSDQYDVWIGYAGYANQGAGVVFGADPAAGEADEFIAFWLSEVMTAQGRVNSTLWSW